MKLAVKNKKRAHIATPVRSNSDRGAGGHVLAAAGKQKPAKIDPGSWEITDQMKLLWRIIRHGYNTALNLSDSVEEIFIQQHKNKKKEELLQEYYDLNKLLQSSL